MACILCHGDTFFDIYVTNLIIVQWLEAEVAQLVSAWPSELGGSPV